MIDERLRAHYATTPVAPGAEARLLAQALATPPRRQLRTGLAVSGSVAAVGTLALVLALVPRSDGHSSIGAGVAPPASASLPASSPSDPGTTAPAPPDRQPVTPQIAVQTLIDLVSGDGTATSPAGRALANTVAGQISFDDGHGVAQLDVALTWKGTAPHDAIVQSCQPAPGCTVLADGTTIATAQSLEYPADPTRPDNSTEWSVSVYHPGADFEVDISEWNAPTPKDSPVSRALPPFTLAELTAIATSSDWTATVTPAAVAAAAGLFAPEAGTGRVDRHDRSPGDSGSEFNRPSSGGRRLDRRSGCTLASTVSSRP